LWSYGTGDDAAWATLSTAARKPYAEIQGGPIGDQSIKLEMQPGETRSHVEYWKPSITRLSIYDLKVPNISLRDKASIPLFDWTANNWLDFFLAFKKDASTPKPPDIADFNWAPSGMEDLAQAFEWAIKKSDGEDQDLWKLYYGAWQAGTGEANNAIKALNTCSLGVAKALLARLLKQKNDVEGALKVITSIKEPWLQIHPQVVIEQDKLLQRIGKQTIPQREQLLSRVNALEDEWLTERQVQLLIDKGEFLKARELLLSTYFQKVHQTYTRTHLWNQICTSLKEKCIPVPFQLGEDRLATFGAYREFD
ncbi:MAG TPA: DUF5107 domain-containing protein, partial [Cyclobacteriaceae bacterium]